MPIARKRKEASNTLVHQVEVTNSVLNSTVDSGHKSIFRNYDKYKMTRDYSPNRFAYYKKVEPLQDEFEKGLVKEKVVSETLFQRCSPKKRRIQSQSIFEFTL